MRSGSRGCRLPWRRFRTDVVPREDVEPGDYLTCTLPDGHPGKHQLAVVVAVANADDDGA